LFIYLNFHFMQCVYGKHDISNKIFRNSQTSMLTRSLTITVLITPRTRHFPATKPTPYLSEAIQKTVKSCFWSLGFAPGRASPNSCPVCPPAPSSSTLVAAVENTSFSPRILAQVTAPRHCGAGLVDISFTVIQQHLN
jgi:hypothetical protein